MCLLPKWKRRALIFHPLLDDYHFIFQLPIIPLLPQLTLSFFLHFTFLLSPSSYLVCPVLIHMSWQHILSFYITFMLSIFRWQWDENITSNTWYWFENLNYLTCTFHWRNRAVVWNKEVKDNNEQQSMQLTFRFFLENLQTLIYRLITQDSWRLRVYYKEKKRDFSLTSYLAPHAVSRKSRGWPSNCVFILPGPPTTPSM